MKEKLKVAVLLENHPHDIVAFQKMMNSFDDLECYYQPIDLFVQDDVNLDWYDVVVWYNMNWNPPEENTPLRAYMEKKIGTTDQGIVLLHHALLTFQGWDLYTNVCGVSDRGGDHFAYHQNEQVQQHIVNSECPITQGVQDFTVIDETYSIGEPDQEGNTILITTDNASGIHNIAWTRQYMNSRVFSYASGHDNQTYSQKGFQQILHNGILWASGKKVNS